MNKICWSCNLIKDIIYAMCTYAVLCANNSWHIKSIFHGEKGQLKIVLNIKLVYCMYSLSS